MRSRIHTLMFAGAAAALAACSDVAATAPNARNVAVSHDATAAAAPVPTASCTYTNVDGAYQTTVTWSSYSATTLTFHLEDGSSPVFAMHPTRNGNVTHTLNSPPTYVLLTGRSTLGLRTQCLTSGGGGPA